MTKYVGIVIFALLFFASYGQAKDFYFCAQYCKNKHKITMMNNSTLTKYQCPNLLKEGEPPTCENFKGSADSCVENNDCYFMNKSYLEKGTCSKKEAEKFGSLDEKGEVVVRTIRPNPCRFSYVEPEFPLPLSYQIPKKNREPHCVIDRFYNLAWAFMDGQNATMLRLGTHRCRELYRMVEFADIAVKTRSTLRAIRLMLELRKFSSCKVNKINVFGKHESFYDFYKIMLRKFENNKCIKYVAHQGMCIQNLFTGDPKNRFPIEKVDITGCESKLIPLATLPYFYLKETHKKISRRTLDSF